MKPLGLWNFLVRENLSVTYWQSYLPGNEKYVKAEEGFLPRKFHSAL